MGDLAQLRAFTNLPMRGGGIFMFPVLTRFHFPCTATF